MMSRKSNIFASSLGWSLAVHAAAASYCVYYSLHVQKHPGRSKSDVTLLLPPELPQSHPLSPTVPPPPPPPPPLVDLDDNFVVGHAGSTGDASDSSDLDGEQTSHLALANQALLSSDPTGQVAASAGRQSPPKPQLDVEQEVALVSPGTSSTFHFDSIGLPTYKSADETKLEPANEGSGSQRPKQEGEQDGQPDITTTERGAPSQPDSASDVEQAAGSPLPQSDRNSDPTSSEVAMEVRAGRLVARDGRQIKFGKVRPNLAGSIDLATVDWPVVVEMMVTVDIDGSVSNVIVRHGSGSTTFDRVVVLAVYGSWFEPKTVKGQPVRDIVTFTFAMYG